MSQLSQFACSPIGDNEPALTPEELENLLPLVPSWALVLENGARKLRAHFTFRTEAHAAEFMERLQQHQETEKHPVEVDHSGSRVRVTCFTAKVDGLHPNDFIMAARADGAWSQVIVGRTGDMARPGRLPTINQSPRFRRILSPARRERGNRQP